MNIILLGAPGAGKGTIAQKMSAALKWPHISTGDILRQHLREGSELGQMAKKYMDAGQLVPDEVIIALMEDRLAKSDCDAGFILDGFPRTIAQAEALDNLLKKLEKRLDKVVSLNVPLDIIVDRMSGRISCKSCGAVYHTRNMPSLKEGICDRCGGELITRIDDQPETVKKRYQVYEEQTAPLIEYYRAKKKMIEIDGRSGGAEEVYEKVKRSIR
ncbi:MAG: adenylate kinase [Candidatus Margulisiibacteriota bacterium]|jgi:adenylate kinase